MKIFISWSSDSKESQDVAIYLKEWIGLIFSTQIDFFISTEIPKGTPGFCEIIEQLKSADLGIICLSKKNLNNRWINFEAGALLNKKPCTILIDLRHSEVPNPLGQLQGTLLSTKDIWNLIKQINEKLPLCGDPAIETTKLEQIFKQMFPILSENIELIQKSLMESVDSPESSNKEPFAETSHLPGIQYNIYQGDLVFPQVHFGMWYPENGLPIQVKVAIEMFLNEKSLGFADPPNGLYNGKTWWNLNPMRGLNGWFELPKEVLEKPGVIEVKINVKVRDLNGKENQYLPVGYVYLKESNFWFFEPGDSLHIQKTAYKFIGWENIPE